MYSHLTRLIEECRLSKSRKRNRLENSSMENFFRILKREIFYGHEYRLKTLDDLKIVVEEYIDYHNNQESQQN